MYNYSGYTQAQLKRSLTYNVILIIKSVEIKCRHIGAKNIEAVKGTRFTNNTNNYSLISLIIIYKDLHIVDHYNYVPIRC